MSAAASGSAADVIDLCDDDIDITHLQPDPDVTPYVSQNTPPALEDPAKAAVKQCRDDVLCQ